MKFLKQDNWPDAIEYKIRNVPWKKIVPAHNGEIYSARMGDVVWKIRMNDFPDEPLYTLIVDGAEKIHFNDWPDEWAKPK